MYNNNISIAILIYKNIITHNNKNYDKTINITCTIGVELAKICGSL